MKTLYIALIGFLVLFSAAAAQLALTSVERAVVNQYAAKYGSPVSLTRGTYNNGVLVVRFNSGGNIISVIIFPDGTSTSSQSFPNSPGQDDEQPPEEADDVADDDVADDSDDAEAPR